MKNYLILFILVSLLMSCNVHKNCAINAIEKEIYVDREVIIHDTVFQVKADSSSFTGRIFVEPNGNITIAPVTRTSGTSLNSPKVSIKDNILTVDCEAKAQELFAQWKESHTTKTVIKTRDILIPLKIPGFKSFLMWVGGIVIVLGALLLGGVLIYKYKQKTKA